jgi:glycosyltransferase involved in cell wall biosynthesis
MVTTHPPTHCGIGAYGEQNAARLRSEGHIVDIVSPDAQGNVDFAWNLRGGTRVLRLARLVPYYDRIVIQYHWAFFYRDLSSREHRRDTLKTTLSFLWLFVRSRKFEVVVHEIPYVTGRLKWLYGLKWKLAPRLILHTPAERERFERHYGMRLADARIQFRKQGDVYQPYAAHTQAEARAKLGVATGTRIFLCIGFIQRHKGFHRAIQAFIEASLPEAELFVVGSLRVADAENQRYLDELRVMARSSCQVHIVESFVSNEDFDTWIRACNWVVLPYSEIWSSAVLGRAKLLDRPSIIAQVGGLPDQADQRDLLFQSEEGLVSAFQLAATSLAQGPVSAQ